MPASGRGTMPTAFPTSPRRAGNRRRRRVRSSRQSFLGRHGTGPVQIDLAGLMQLPGVCQEPRDETDEIARHGPVVRELSVLAVQKLHTMRQREGDALFKDLMKHVNGI